MSFQSVRIQAGDYIQPADDRRALWRITRYTEYGDGYWVLEDGTEKQIKGDFWAVWRYTRPVVPGDFEVPDDFLEWENWEQWDSTLPTKRAAIESALKQPA